jgi:tripartite-type tricarboxylate transporter receptor subunit TctC
MKFPHRRKFLHLAAGAAALSAVPRLARAQAYPTRPVRIVVGYAAGGGADIFARIIGQSLSERLGQPFVIENRPGASTNIATETVARSPADGYVLLAVDGAAASNATIYEKLNFNFVRDFVLVGMIRGPVVMVVHPSVPVKAVSEFITYGKAHQGMLSMGSAGTGSPGHVAGELFQMATGMRMTHVPYRGAAPAIADLLGGQVQAVFMGPPSVIEHIRAGRLRALAVTTAARLESLPEVPAMNEFVSGYEATQWYAVALRENTRSDIVEKLNTEINIALADDKTKVRIADLGMTAFPAPTADLSKYVADETEKWAKVIRAANIKPE